MQPKRSSAAQAATALHDRKKSRTVVTQPSVAREVLLDSHTDLDGAHGPAGLAAPDHGFVHERPMPMPTDLTPTPTDPPKRRYRPLKLSRAAQRRLNNSGLKGIPNSRDLFRPNVHGAGAE